MMAKAMVHQPPVLVLDEPTAGVYIELRQQLWANVRELNRAGTTVLLTTHYLEEAEELCDKIAIINHGRVIACDDTDSLLARLDSKALTLVFDRDLADVPDCLMAFHAEQTGPRRVQFRSPTSESPVPPLPPAVCAAGTPGVDLPPHEAE